MYDEIRHQISRVITHRSSLSVIVKGGHRMDADRFDQLARAWGIGATRRRVLGSVLGAALAGLGARRLAAQSTAGSGGYATASATGGTVVTGDINTGGNVGNIISVGNTYGSVWVDAGNVSNTTNIDFTANGGTAIADASGGSGNIAGVDQSGAWENCNCNACWTGGEYCCNWSCGICVPYGDSCWQGYCDYCEA
jgi:hypothetical protein